MDGVRTSYSSGSPFEPRFGFSRAVRVGQRVLVAGTGPVWPDGTCSPDAEVQARRCLEIIALVLAEAGARPEDVVRTRMYVTGPEHVDAVGRAHASVFAGIRPVATLVLVAGLVDARWCVEIEAEAFVGAHDQGTTRSPDVLEGL